MKAMKIKNKLNKTILGFAVLAGAVFSYGDSLANEGMNLIANPSFETVGANGDPTNWFRGGYGTNTRIFTYPTVGHDDSKAAKVEITNYTSGDAKWYFGDVPVIGGNIHTLVHSYNSNVPTKLGARYQIRTGGYVYQFLATFPASNEWTSEMRTIIVPANATKLTIFHVINTVGSLETDAFLLTPGSPPPQPILGNLIVNSSFAEIGANGDPVGWFRGGYGENIRSYGVGSCSYYSGSEFPYSTEDLRGAFAFRPACPSDTLYTLSVGISDYKNGDAKWYFADVPIGANKDFTISYQYRSGFRVPEIARPQAIARYTFQGGSYRYAVIGEMPQVNTPTGQGYISWRSTTHQFTAPNGATSLTIFFTVNNPGASGVSIANVVLKNVVSPN